MYQTASDPTVTIIAWVICWAIAGAAMIGVIQYVARGCKSWQAPPPDLAAMRRRQAVLQAQQAARRAQRGRAR